jgi:thymidylate synthase
MEILARNVNEMLPEIFWRFRGEAEEMDSRNGKVWYIDEPVILTYTHPLERVAFSLTRDANPIFHLMEAIWILAGRRDVAFPDLYNRSLKQYSDYGEIYNAAYGHRMRHAFGQDQLVEVINHLRRDPLSRQAVIQLWYAGDLNKKTKDKACNMTIVFRIEMGQLDMSVMNRSNDVWYGACGANVVHFTFIQEFIANALDIGVGRYRQISNNLHLYQDLYGDKVNISQLMDSPFPLEDCDEYQSEEFQAQGHYHLLKDVNWRQFLRECDEFCDDPTSEADYDSAFLREVAFPMAMVQKRRREGRTGVSWCNRIQAFDWQLATRNWISLREEAKDVKQG